MLKDGCFRRGSVEIVLERALAIVDELLGLTIIAEGLVA